MKIDFIIVGAQKSGSTFLHHCLKEHPEVYMPENEIAFFEDPDFDEDKISEFEKIFDGINNKSLGIKRPNYLTKSECPGRLYKYSPEAKIIIILRNPIDRFISAYYHYMKSGFIPVRKLDKGFENLIKNKYKKFHPRSAEIIEFGFYYKYLREYFKYYKKEKIKIVLFEELKNDSEKVIKDLYSFLNVNKDYRPKALNYIPQKGVYSLGQIYLNRIRHKLMYGYNKKKTRLYVKKRGVITRMLSKTIIRIEKMTKIFFIKKKPQLNSKNCAALISMYQYDISSLENLLNIKLDEWKS